MAFTRLLRGRRKKSPGGSGREYQFGRIHMVPNRSPTINSRYRGGNLRAYRR
ncbi:MAG: hypothetical protein PHG58_01915 [Clostridia bacterium]|nr:hypothetical protein [Clostridia bacterium]